MKSLRLLVPVGIVLALIGCDKDDPTPKDFVTYTMEVQGNWWMFASDPDGNLLDAKQLVFNEAVSLSVANPPDSFSLTIVKIERESPPALELTTYAGVKPGSVFAPKPYVPEDSEQVSSEGKVTIEVTNYPDDQSFPLIVSDEFQNTTHNFSGTSTATFLMSLWAGKPRRFLVTGYDRGLLKPVYRFIETGEAGTTTTVDFGTLEPFEKTIEITGFETELDVHGTFNMYSSPKPDILGVQFSDLDWNYTDASPVTKVGYLDEFTDYWFQLRLIESNEQGTLLRNQIYTHLGPLTAPITIRDDQHIIHEHSLPNYGFTYSGSYDLRRHSFGYEENNAVVSWFIYSGFSGKVPITQLPNEVLALVPGLTLNAIVHRSSRFYNYDDGYTYKKFIQDAMTTSFGPPHPGYIQIFR